MFIWIWQLEKQFQRYGGIDGLINKLRLLNINDVCIKFHEGSGPVGGGINFRDAYLRYKDIFKAAGFRVGTWGYNYFNHIKEEANMIIDALNNSDYYIFDPEVDVSGKVSQAEQICQLVRNAHPQGYIGYSSFPIVSYHRDIPYEVFNRYCDFASPQVYWATIGWSVEKVMNKTLEDHRACGLDKPIYPSIQSYNCIPQGYAQYDGYNFSMTGAWSLDNMDSTFEQYAASKAPVQSNPQTQPGSTAPEGILYNEKVLKFQRACNAMCIRDEFGRALEEDGKCGKNTTYALNRTETLVKRSMRNPLVGVIQELLNITVDNDYGNAPYHETYDAVGNFQEANDLLKDYVVWVKTWSKLLGI